MAARESNSDSTRRADLRRMKGLATGLLIGAAVVFAATYLGGRDARGWLGFVRAAAEAGIVGGLADWFAVTALFRHPLGLPIPHTAIIPTRKAAIGRSLGDFVGENFLSAAVVRERVNDAQLPLRISSWLAEPAHARRVVDEAAAVVGGSLRVLRDEDVRAVVGQSIHARLASLSVAPALGAVLGSLIERGAHHDLVDLLVNQSRSWLAANGDVVRRLVTAEAPAWTPRFLDNTVATVIHQRIVTFADEVAADRLHPVRGSLDSLLGTLAEDLSDDADTQETVDRLVALLIDLPASRKFVGDALTSAREMLVELVEDPDGELRKRATEAVGEFAARIRTDAALQAKLGNWLEDAAVHVVTTYRGELTSVISQTVERWDADDTSRRIELQVGRDLQYIRLNGTIVGALAGVAIHAAALALG
jgi:uncharacterized membrane-anchored protein YjiN (DUF445 family)